jgi:aryl sulfotransferase
MRRDAAKIAPGVTSMFEKGPETFFFKASNGRWRDVLSAQDLARYQAKVGDNFSPACAAWVERGREGGADPSVWPD